MALCRNEECGCENIPGTDGSNPLFCEACEGFGPICPHCGAPYGEHAMDCDVADEYLDCGEGPWADEAGALEFAQAEVGVAWQITRSPGGKWFVMVKEE